MPLTLSYTVGFSSNEAKTIGSIRVTDTTNWAGQGINPANVEIGIGITAPDGTTYRPDTVPQTGNIHPAVQLWMEFPLPLDITGVIQTGDYTISYHVVSAIGPIDQTETSVHNLCADFPTLCLTPNPDCLRLIVSITDETGWTAAGWTVNSRAMILQYPSVTYHANITGAGPTISTSGEPIWAGTWTGTVTVSVTKDNYTVSITTVKQFEVSCDFDGCRLLCMLESKYSEYTKAKTRGDVRRTGEILADLQQMATLSQIIQMSIGCGDDTLVNTLIREFKIIATGNDLDNCDCCDDCSEPRELVPIWSSGGDAWTPLAGNNITITAGVNTYTFSVSTAFANLVASLYNTEVISSDGSVNITDATVGIVKTFDLSVANPATDSMEFVWTVTPPGTFALSSPEIVGTEFQAPTLTYTGGAFYAVTGFFTGTPFPVNVQVSILDVTRRAPYDVTHRNNILVDVQVYTEANTFTIGLIPEDLLFGSNRGQAKDATFFRRYITTMEILFKITKK